MKSAIKKQEPEPVVDPLDKLLVELEGLKQVTKILTGGTNEPAKD